jgi:predicted phage terminase large subunit-like protein
MTRPSLASPNEAAAKVKQLARLSKEIRGRNPKPTKEQEAKLFDLLDAEALEAEKARRKLSAFIEKAWPIVEPTNEFVSGWYLEAICEHLEALAVGQIRNLLITVPPRSGKSTTCSVMYPPWLWLRWPHLRMIYSSYQLSRSYSDAIKCRNVIQSPWYQRNFGHLYKLISDNVGKLQTDKTGFRFSTSTDSATIGEGGDLIVCDDPHNVRDIHSDAEREKAIYWWSRIVPSRLDNLRTGRKLIIQQRLHTQDLAGYVLELGGYTHLNIPLEFVPTRRCFTSIGWQDPRTQENEIMCPRRFPPEEVYKLKTKEPAEPAYSAMFQQDPLPKEGSIIKIDWLKYYEDDPASIYDRAHRVIQAWDASFKGKATSSYVVGQVWAKIGNDIYLIDQIRDRMDFVATLEAVGRLTYLWPKTQEKLIEDRANGSAIISTLKSKIQGIVPVDVNNDEKEARLSAVSWLFQSGHIHLPKTAPWLHEYVSELTRFPSSAYTDQVDATAMALDRLSKQTYLPHAYPIGIGSGSFWLRRWDR